MRFMHKTVDNSLKTVDKLGQMWINRSNFRSISRI